MALNDEGVRIPVDASPDVQKSVQDIRDALRALRIKQEALEANLAESVQRADDESASIREEIAPGNFTEVKEETVFLGPVTFDGNVTGINTDPSVIVPDLGYRIYSDDPSLKYSLNGHTHVAGGLYCSKLTSGGDADVFGTARVNGNVNIGNNLINSGVLKSTINDTQYDLGSLIGDGVYCMIRRAATQSISASTTTQISFDTSVYESGGNFWTSGTDVTPPVPGAYLCIGSIYWDSQTWVAHKHQQNYLTRNGGGYGTRTGQQDHNTPGATMRITHSFSNVMSFNGSTDYAGLSCYHTDSGSKTVNDATIFMVRIGREWA